uniref:Uncharacterized protein n=1 Tax=Schizaphis graminum TaxID=13262 RepID=A0A2S2P707_SCHGA
MRRCTIYRRVAAAVVRPTAAAAAAAVNPPPQRRICTTTSRRPLSFSYAYILYIVLLLCYRAVLFTADRSYLRRPLGSTYIIVMYVYTISRVSLSRLRVLSHNSRLPLPVFIIYYSHRVAYIAMGAQVPRACIRICAIYYIYIKLSCVCIHV